MRRNLTTPLVALALALCALAGWAATAQAQQPPSPQQAAKPEADLTDVLTYVRLFGYRDMLQMGVERQLAELSRYYRAQRPDISAQTLDTIFGELRAELAGGVDEGERDMARVLQRHLNRDDVAYLIGVGQDPRMQRVVRMQPAIARDLEPIGEKLADDMVTRALPRIEQRLRALPGSRGGAGEL